jgi:hypothetical protein
MTAAAARAAPAARPSALEIFVARAEARAMLWTAGELTLHEAVDELWAAAVRDGLVAKLGADEVQRLMAEAFAAVRDDFIAACDQVATSGNLKPEVESASSGASFEDNYTGLSPSFAALCRAADEKRRRKPPEPRPVERVPISTLRAAEYLARQNDPKRFRAWLAKHTAAERAAIHSHLLGGRR